MPIKPISISLSPNVEKDDVWLALKLIVQPWRWKRNHAVEKLYDWVLQNDLNVILDGTFSNFEKSKSNIIRSLQKKRGVAILYVYQEPTLAWDFTKKREKLEGRNIPRDAFIRSFVAAKENVDRAKEFFGDKIQLHLILKDYSAKTEDFKGNVDNVASYLKKVYSINELEKIII